MYEGKPSKGLEFYDLLNKSEKFTSELGKIALASGRLEVEFIMFLTKNKVKGNYKKATLGRLIRLANENKLLSENENQVFDHICKLRNYITHNIYALFSDSIEETILESENLLDSDVYLYTETAWQLTENLNGLADVIKTKRNNL
ncbi:hypothetical protein KO500_15960 [Cellulophaga baltica]|uniref:hypothetical protein n=1 Tax=Cellulophaga TaxID=104264 RepID=UPI001C06FADB|nr:MULTISPECIES: hypothetical protein [Cellulophaga]MBU2997938.1 hypothetical protein [Cellulophaga baltica]MDO6769339.1 hypothetical protein [Cellulophaga sp. 1_MG-2023]